MKHGMGACQHGRSTAGDSEWVATLMCPVAVVPGACVRRRACPKRKGHSSAGRHALSGGAERGGGLGNQQGIKGGGRGNPTVRAHSPSGPGTAFLCCSLNVRMYFARSRLPFGVSFALSIASSC